MNRIIRAARYYFYKIVRTKATPHKAAMGTALGLMVGCVVPIGVQTVVVLALAFPLKADKFLAVFFTFITNPWTAPFYYPAVCLLGAYLLGDQELVAGGGERFMAVVNADSLSQSWENLKGLGPSLLEAYLAGSAAAGLVFSAIGYMATYWIVDAYHRRRQRRCRAGIAATST